MTLRDLVAEVSTLGFDGEISCDTLFLTSLKRCLAEIFTTQKITSHIVLHKSKERVSARYSSLRYNGRDAVSLPLMGHALTFYTTGRGTYTLIYGAHARSFAFSGESVRHSKALMGSGGKIVFSGDSPFTVTNLFVFSDFYGDESDIPDSVPLIKYDMNELVDDFLAFDELAKDENGKELECVSFDSGCVLVDEKYEGDIHIVYRRLPNIPMTSDPERKIDIPREYEHLLPILLASYIFIDTDEKKALHYRELYSSMATHTEKKRTAQNKLSDYRDTNGWA